MDRDKLPHSFVVAIDGPAGSGKSTLAKLLAKEINAKVIDTGAMYRSVTAIAMDSGIDITNESAVVKKTNSVEIVFRSYADGQKVIVNGQNYTERIRDPIISDTVSIVASYALVRAKMIEKQREMGSTGRIVMEGRDIGSFVFPKAEFKFFLLANDEIRARRRMTELKNAGIEASIEEVLRNIKDRDRLDSSRISSPLVKADGAVEINTSNLNIDEALSRMLDCIFSGGGGS
ncbi:MAG TPA: (d)CMP kinase [Nitrospinota bacterium]|nr:(d)CMP kinase [Nitrospinota bacterium]|tara:strand:+ start:17200 stop:17895 length:696 start_codon:yes stop_codon:yes gene_type:complete